MNDRIVTIATYENMAQSDVFRTILESHGIECFLPNEQMATIRPEIMSGTGGMQLQVRETDAKQALIILEQSTAINEPEAEIDAHELPLDERPRLITTSILIFFMICLFLVFWQLMMYWLR